ncbi:hypothetical protein HNP48_002022 [Acidovorax soli]|uniref:Uncharacterized protein n=1 Tax=Acidovorax soli TaxID=592050 RepID=A0A7X0PCG7_9BURK|nr:hypothetical protein [Acidovorax soli]MBB6559355.1 hypothetical protein [Acidovorax soli]
MATLGEYARSGQLVFSVYIRDIGSHKIETELPDGKITRTVSQVRFLSPEAAKQSPLRFLRASDSARIFDSLPHEAIRVPGTYTTADLLPKNGTQHMSGLYFKLEDLVLSREERDRFELEHRLTPPGSAPTTKAALRQLLKLCDRFPLVVHAHQYRHASRQKQFDMRDEYDMQDLMNGLLVAQFEDVRDEDVVPYKAGQTSRIDFLLSSDEIGVELKYVRESMSDRTLGTQLLEDINRYRAHPSVKALVFLVYDPDRRIKKPEAMMKDLSGSHNECEVHVLIKN